MVKFLDTKLILASIQEIIKNANDFVYLVSPYMDIEVRFEDLIKEKEDDGVAILLIYGKKKKQFEHHEETKEFIASLTHSDVYYCKELHAKCYLNEQEAVITSMNLYEASDNNFEMGVLITKKEDCEIYERVLKEIDRIKKKSEIQKLTKLEGFCIRCKKSIQLNADQPYCDEHYKKWSKYENKDYEETKGFCHVCGQQNISSMSKPLCITCFKKTKKMIHKMPKVSLSLPKKHNCKYV